MTYGRIRWIFFCNGYEWILNDVRILCMPFSLIDIISLVFNGKIVCVTREYIYTEVYIIIEKINDTAKASCSAMYRYNSVFVISTWMSDERVLNSQLTGSTQHDKIPIYIWFLSSTKRIRMCAVVQCSISHASISILISFPFYVCHIVRWRKNNIPV